MAEQLVCCCGASGWTKVIAWLQIVYSGIEWVKTGLIVVPSLTALLEAHSSGDPDDPATAEKIHILNWALIIFGPFFIFYAIGLVMGIVLLRGSHSRRPDLLRKWIIWGYIWLVIWLVLGCVHGLNIPNDSQEFSIALFTMILGAVGNGFCIWVVGAHKREIEQDDTVPLVIVRTRYFLWRCIGKSGSSDASEEDAPKEEEEENKDAFKQENKEAFLP